MTATQLTAFLKRLEELVPTHPNGHHAITYAQYGSEDVGWQDRLALHVRLTDTQNLTLFIDDADLKKTPEVLALDAAEQVRKAQ